MKAPYAGKNCDLLMSLNSNSSCFDNKCKNKATCYVISEIKYGCSCSLALKLPGEKIQIGYAGEYCETSVIPCSSNLCLNNQECYTFINGSQYCSCNGIN